MFLRLVFGVGLLASAAVGLQAQHADPRAVNGFVWTANFDAPADLTDSSVSPLMNGVLSEANVTPSNEPLAINSAIVPSACTVTGLYLAASNSTGSGAAVLLIKNGGYNGFAGTGIMDCITDGEQRGAIQTCSTHLVPNPDSAHLKAGDILSFRYYPRTNAAPTHVTTMIVCN